MRKLKQLSALLIVLSLFVFHACGPKYGPAITNVVQIPDYVRSVPNPLAGYEKRVDDLMISSFNEGWQYFKAGQLEKASEKFKFITENDKKFFPAWAGLAYVEMMEEDYSGARRWFNRALAVNRDYLPAMLGLGILYRVMNEPLKAFNLYGVILEKYPGQAEAKIQYDLIRLQETEKYLLLARNYRQTGDFDPAYENYKKAMNFVLQEDFIYSEIGLFLLEYRKYKDALPYLQRAVDLRPGNARYIKPLAFALENTGKYSQARNYYKKLLEINPSDRTVRNDIERVASTVKKVKSGAKTGSLSAGQQITRAQAAVYLEDNYPFLGDPPPGDNRIITDIIDSPHAVTIINLVKRGIFEVYPDHTFGPKRKLNRVDLAILLGRLIEHSLPSTSIRLNTKGVHVKINDVPIYSPSYRIIKKVVALGLIPLDAQKNFHPSRLIKGKEFILAIDKLVNLVQ